MPRKDPEAKKAYQRAYYANKYHGDAEYREHFLERKRRNTAAQGDRNKDTLSEFKSLGCAYCTECDEAAMATHHVDRATKEADVANLVWRYGVDRFKAELAKCECVCHNCHYKLHNGVKLLRRRQPGPLETQLSAG